MPIPTFPRLLTLILSNNFDSSPSVAVPSFVYTTNAPAPSCSCELASPSSFPTSEPILTCGVEFALVSFVTKSTKVFWFSISPVILCWRVISEAVWDVVTPAKAAFVFSICNDDDGLVVPIPIKVLSSSVVIDNLSCKSPLVSDVWKLKSAADVGSYTILALSTSTSVNLILCDVFKAVSSRILPSFTWSFSVGVSSPIPTFPLESIVILSVPAVLTLNLSFAGNPNFVLESPLWRM